MKRGFSLIELLVVIGIIGVLASVVLTSLNAARRAGRDSRRISDLKQAQLALQLYYLKCGNYPGSYNQSSNRCVGGDASSFSINTENPNNWKDLTDTLNDAEIGFGAIPNDPLINKTYSYWVQLGESTVTPKAQCYVLRAELETDHKALKKDVDNQEIIDKLLPLTCVGVGCKNLYPAPPQFNPINCDDTATDHFYCVGNIECFYGL